MVLERSSSSKKKNYHYYYYYYYYCYYCYYCYYYYYYYYLLLKIYRNICFKLVLNPLLKLTFKLFQVVFDGPNPCSSVLGETPQDFGDFWRKIPGF